MRLVWVLYVLVKFELGCENEGKPLEFNGKFPQRKSNTTAATNDHFDNQLIC